MDDDGGGWRGADGGEGGDRGGGGGARGGGRGGARERGLAEEGRGEDWCGRDGGARGLQGVRWQCGGAKAERRVPPWSGKRAVLV